MLYQLLFGPFLLIMQNWIGAGVFKILMKYFELRHYIPVLHKNASVKIALHDTSLGAARGGSFGWNFSSEGLFCMGVIYR